MSAKNDNVSLLQRIHWVCNTIFHQLVAVVAVYITYIFFKHNEINDKSLWHNFLCTCAYVPLMAEGIILFSDQNVWSQRLDRTKKYYVHGIFLTVSTIAVTIGISLKIYSKNQGTSKHFQTDHAITGLVSWILALTSVILGLFATYSQSLKNFVKPVIIKFIHSFLGFSSFAIGITSLCLGLYKEGFALNVTENEKITTVWLVGIVSVWSVLIAIISMLNQVKTIIKSN